MLSGDIGPPVGPGNTQGLTSRFLFLLIQNVYRIICQGQGAVGVFVFRGASDTGDLPPYPEVTSLQIKVLPFEPQELSRRRPMGSST